MRVRMADGDRTLEPQPGDSIAAAMVESGLHECRRTEAGDPRGVFCGMGVCYECRVSVAGRGVCRACMSPAADALDVRQHGTDTETVAALQVASSPPEELDVSPDVLIVGGGPAGLAAAETSASRGLKVVVIDERQSLGGQYFKQPTDGFAKGATENRTRRQRRVAR